MQPLLDAALSQRSEVCASLALAWSAYVGYSATHGGGGPNVLVDLALQVRRALNPHTMCHVTAFVGATPLRCCGGALTSMGGCDAAAWGLCPRMPPQAVQLCDVGAKALAEARAQGAAPDAALGAALAGGEVPHLQVRALLGFAAVGLLVSQDVRPQCPLSFLPMSSRVRCHRLLPDRCHPAPRKACCACCARQSSRP